MQDEISKIEDRLAELKRIPPGFGENSDDNDDNEDDNDGAGGAASLAPPLPADGSRRPPRPPPRGDRSRYPSDLVDIPLDLQDHHQKHNISN